MAKRIKKKPIDVIQSRDEMENCVREICRLSIRKDEMTAQMDEELSRVRDNYQSELAEVCVNLNTELERAQDWSERNPDEFAAKKSIVFVHGTAGFRTGTPKLKTLSGWTWDKVLAVVKKLTPEFVRTKAEVDREMIIANRERLGADLKRMGLEVVQDETFYVEPNREAVKS
ncbi:MAG TPA: host-nuclease inhibitor Gam family protein [Kiritimatiellia bacterium]|nr:host-nuclease inhibitor Gam family protein [Kiritimatiellia bacterium]HMO99645.1 host-nuclease inhibitor Gam family protein [Kiritimatiellia bacterium]HMP97108.1 host-nuclease inhibitor Gam family protein [Kiritimatiellia bacterium]